MEINTLLIVGAVVAAFTCGASFPVRIPMEPLPSHVTDLAKELGELHVAHEQTRDHQQRYLSGAVEVNQRLAAHIEKLKSLFGWSV